MNNNAYSYPIPQWKDAESSQAPAAAPQPYGAGEWEASYLLPQWLVTAELPGNPSPA